MTELTGTITALAAAAAIGLAGAASSDGGSSGAGGSRDGASPARIALVVDADTARDGRELVDPRLLDIDAEVRLPRDSREARTNVRYFDELGYRVVVVGARARAAADATGVDALRATDLSQALTLR